MSLFSYQLFCTIAEQKSMIRAAELLHITPSATTHSMNALEKSVGFPLLNRHRNGVTLTPNGELLLPQFQAVLAEEIRLQEMISQINGLERGRIRVGVLASVCQKWLPTILASFNKKYPNIEVQVYQDSYQPIESMLLDGSIDLGFLSLPTSDQFDTIPVLHDELFCVTPVDFIPENPPYVSPEELRKQTLILSLRGRDRSIQNYLTLHDLNSSDKHIVNLESSVIALVEAGLGCSILPQLVLDWNPGNYNVYTLQDNRFRVTALATLKGRKKSLACIKMIQEIQDLLNFQEADG